MNPVLDEARCVRCLASLLPQPRLQNGEWTKLAEPSLTYHNTDCHQVRNTKRKCIYPMPVPYVANEVMVQLLRMPLITLSAAITAYVEVHGSDDEAKNRLCTPVPFPTNLKGYARASLMSLMNQFQWSQDKQLRQRMRTSRLDAFGKMVSEIDKADTEKQATLARLRVNTQAATTAMAALMV